MTWVFDLISTALNRPNFYKLKDYAGLKDRGTLSTDNPKPNLCLYLQPRHKDSYFVFQNMIRLLMDFLYADFIG